VDCIFYRTFVVVLPRVAKTYQRIIGETIRHHRKRLNFSQEQLAEKADLHPVYIGELERGEETASVASLIRIAKALGVRVRDLLIDL
jgi:transcriptional regulator with XRE-family HTH domain